MRIADTPENLGLKTSDTVHLSYTDVDHHLMVFDPQHINESGKVKMTYQSMMQMTQLTGEIVNVLEKRVAAAREREIVRGGEGQTFCRL